MDMQGLDNEFDNFGEGSSSGAFAMADHPHSEHQPTTNTNSHHTPSDHNDSAPEYIKPKRKYTRSEGPEEERARRLTTALEINIRKNLRKLKDLSNLTQAELLAVEAEERLKQEAWRIEKRRKERAAKAVTSQARKEKRLAVKAERQQQQGQDPVKDGDDHQERKPKVEDEPSKKLRRSIPDSELTEKELATRLRAREASREYRKRQRELLQLAQEGKPLPPPCLVAMADRRFQEEEARLQKLQEDVARKIVVSQQQKAQHARYAAKRREEKLAAGIIDKRFHRERPFMTEEERAKLDEKNKAGREAGKRFRERQRAKKFLQSLAGALQMSAVTQPDPQLESIKEKVLTLRTKKGQSVDDPIRVDELEAILPLPKTMRQPSKSKGNFRPRKRRSKKMLAEEENAATKADLEANPGPRKRRYKERQAEEGDATPAVVPALELQTHPLRQAPREESRLFKKRRPKVLDPGVPDLRPTTASHLAYSLMNREQRLALTLSVLDPEKEFEAYRWPVQESVLPSVPASKYLDEDARLMPDSFERKGMAFVSELTGVPKTEHDYKSSTSEGEDDEDDEDEQERLLEERRARKRQRKEQHENERSSTQRLTEVHRFFREEVTTLAQKQYHKAFQHLKAPAHPDLNIRGQDELSLLQENAAAFSAEDTLLGVLDRIQFVIRQGALGKNPEYAVSGRKPVASDASYERGWNSVMLAATMAGVDERILKKVSYRMKTLLSHSRNVYYHESAPQNTSQSQSQDPDQDQDQDQDQGQEHPQVDEEDHYMEAYYENLDTDEELVDLKDVFNMK
ncbi:hypothetical protein BGZ74_003262 [Mortierella antarctica]|nr:hypothetical protein BGZ74_003262 [Mortierella antarctica]